MRKYIVETILPTEEVHLLAGPSGSGKTTWLFQILKDWLQSKPVLNFPSYPTSYVYIACDRSSASVHATLERIGIEPSTIPVISLVDTPLIGSIHELGKRAQALVPDCQFLIIDGIASLTPDGKINDYKVVAKFLIDLTHFCQLFHFTILGIVHCAKVKEKEGYQNARQRIMGSAAWAAYTETILLIEPMKPDDPANQERKLFLLPRNAAETTLNYKLDDRGRFIENNIVEDVAFANLDFWLGKISLTTETFATPQAIAEGERLEAIPRTVERWLKDRVEGGRLERVSRGLYRIRKTV